MEKIMEYIKIRNTFLSKQESGLSNSKIKCGDSGNWTPEDERDLLILNSRKKELQSILGKITSKKFSMNYFIKKQKQNIEDMKK